MTDKELLKECKNFIDNYAMWEERDYDGFNLANKIEKQLTIPRVSDLLIAWEQYKKANWWESEAIDVEKHLMEKIAAIYKH